ncbi:hypothetical protein [Sphingobacterium daejeonense]|uniref:hypothetical protein n=1 Tax=Sphingobacterium daejeonense TaxID=371142 RepID=UPI0010C5A299|nr:hypothetical protein [Sphingobacterium daejeonense]VTQ02156.1 Uncharacterised protein [Sphingobacterium daejeonense]
MRKDISFRYCIVLLFLLLQGFVTIGQDQLDSLSKYSHDELFDRAFETRSTLYLEYLENQKLTQEEKKQLYLWFYYLTAANGKLDITLNYLQKLDSISALTKDPKKSILRKIGFSRDLLQEIGL